MQPHRVSPELSPQEWLQWYQSQGVTDALSDTPTGLIACAKHALPKETPPPETPAALHRTAPEAPAAAPVIPTPVAPALTTAPSEGIRQAQTLAASATSLESLEASIRQFEGCSLRRTATNTVFKDGTVGAPLLLIGEAPGAEEDAQGIPFCGPSGQLLDKMLASIGMSRSENVLITNMIYWRPPGNRKPSTEETAICLPFVLRTIELSAPKLIIVAGGTAASALLDTPVGITRLRGKLQTLTTPNGKQWPVLPLYHPAYLLRQPSHKRYAWQDLLLAKNTLF